MDWSTADGIKRNNFDFLRLVLAVTVIYSHSFLISHGPNALDAFESITHGQINGGFLAVNGFFAISGFLIAHSWMTAPGFRRYFFRRARRILPGYLAAMIFCALLVAPLAARPWQSVFSPHWLAHVLENTVLLKAYPGSPRLFAANPSPAIVNGSMWTIEFEFCCYLLLGLAGVLGLLRGKWASLLIFAAIMLWYALDHFHLLDAMHGGHWQRINNACDHLFGGNQDQWPRLLASFWAGVCFYSWRTRIPRSKWLAMTALVVMALGIAVRKEEILLPLAATYVLFFVAYEPALGMQNFGRSGDFSYGTYLYAYPLQQLIIQSLPGLGSMAVFALSTPASLIAGAISWYAIEQHFGLRKHRQLREGFIGPAKPGAVQQNVVV